MAVPDELAPLLAPLAAVQRLDAMLIFDLDDLPQLMESAVTEDFDLRSSNVEQFARQHRMLLLHHAESDTEVDISLGALPFEVETVERGTTYQIGSLAVRLPTPEDLIIMKAVAHRPMDLIDIQSLIETNLNLDKARIERWVREFADFFDAPELWDDIARWF